jgi:hypothetical protein
VKNLEASLCFAALPTDASARFTRFEHPAFLHHSGEEWHDTSRLVPVSVVKEWVWPRNGDPMYKTVRISEHRWPLWRSTFMCKPDVNRTADTVEWPARPPAISRAELMCANALTPAWAYQPNTDSPFLEMQAQDKAVAFNHYLNGNPAPNDGLPDDYLDFWRESDLTSEM